MVDSSRPTLVDHRQRAGLLAHVLVEALVLDRSGEAVGEQLEQLDLIVPEERGRGAAENENTDDPIVDLERQRDLRLRSGCRADVARVGVDVVDDHRLTALDDHPHQPLADTEAPMLDDLLGDPRSVGELELPAEIVQQQHRERVVGQALLQLDRHPLERLGEVGRGVERLGGRQQTGERARRGLPDGGGLVGR